MYRCRLKARDWNASNEDSTGSYLAQRQALSKGITSLHVPQRLYIPGSQSSLNAIDTILLADHPENVELWLPSALPSASRDTQCAINLPQIEYQLRCAQAANALHNIQKFRRLIQFLALKMQSHIANTQRTTMRTHSLFNKMRSKLNQEVSTYRASRRVIQNLAPNKEFGPWKEALLELQDNNIRGPGREESETSEP